MVSQIERENLTRSMKWKLADMLEEENLPYVNEFCEPVRFRETFYTKYMKRLLDILISSVALIVTLPLNLIVSFITYFDVGRPIIFEQKRIGKDEKLFTLKKFRNMTNDRDANGELLPPSQRVTKWGKFVRKSSIDELLNFWCIFKGEMSVIGPRPLDEPYMKRFNARHRARFFVRPGLECPPRDMRSNLRTWNEQFENDVWYAENVSFMTDLKLMINLFRFVFNREFSKMRGQATRGDFLGYSAEGVAVTQFDLPDEYLDRLLNKEKETTA